MYINLKVFGNHCGNVEFLFFCGGVLRQSSSNGRNICRYKLVEVLKPKFVEPVECFFWEGKKDLFGLNARSLFSLLSNRNKIYVT